LSRIIISRFFLVKWKGGEYGGEAGPVGRVARSVGPQGRKGAIPEVDGLSEQSPRVPGAAPGGPDRAARKE